MTTLDILSQIRSALVEPVAGFWSDAELLLWVNRAVSDYVNRTRVLEGKDETSTQAGVADYPLPSACLSVRAIFVNTASAGQDPNYQRIRPSNLEKVSQENPSFLDTGESTQSSPYTYFVWGKVLTLIPTPKEADHTIVMFFKAKPIDIATSSQQLDLDDSLHESVIAYVLWRAFEKEKEFEQAQYHREIYEGYIKHGLRWQKKQSGDQRYRIDIDSPIPLDGRSDNRFNPLS